MTQLNHQISIFTTVRRDENTISYTDKILELIEANEQYGFSGALFFQNNSNDLEPWVFAQEMFNRSSNQIPLIAINPAYVHPFTAAQKILSYFNLHRRKLFINFIIGTSKSDLESIETPLGHDERYDRLREYIEIMNELLKGTYPMNYQGTYYQIKNLRLPYPLDEDYFPKHFISGSSEKAFRTRTITNSYCLQMAKSKKVFNSMECKPDGIYLGIIARTTLEEARNALIEKFKPKFPEAKELLKLSMSNTDAVWKNELLKEKDDETFRLEPFKNFSADCPYLVGTYSHVAKYLLNYIIEGVNTFVIDVEVEEMGNISQVFKCLNTF
ncbi:LLM class flavin-dependent oxidoreductase [Yeosuana marina]|uniref:LLM class flavin-dependent oxidoreductase n=1 Tax=Yeosuana marina TaxID=1565536 RepID=UPI0030C82E03